MMNNLYLGSILEVTIETIYNYGVFIKLPDGRRGFIRRRELDYDPRSNPSETLHVGETILAQVISLDAGRIELSRKQLLPDKWESFSNSVVINDILQGRVVKILSDGIRIQIIPGIEGFIEKSNLATWNVAHPDQIFVVDDWVEAVVIGIDPNKKYLELSITLRMLQRERVARIMQKISSIPKRFTHDDTEENSIVDDINIERDILDLAGKILIVEDKTEVLDSMVDWLHIHGFTVNGVSSLNEAASRIEQDEFWAVFLDLNMHGQSGLSLVSAIKKKEINTAIFIMAIPDDIRIRSRDLSNARITNVLAKPILMSLIIDLWVDLCKISKWTPWFYPPEFAVDISQLFDRYTIFADTNVFYLDKLKTTLDECTKLIQADFSILFEWDYSEKVARVLVSTDHDRSKYTEQMKFELRYSPVADIVYDGQPRLINNVEYMEPAYRKLLNYFEFKASLGVPILVGNEVTHVLYLFKYQPYGFAEWQQREVFAYSILLSAILEKQVLNRTLEKVNSALIEGDIASSFNHEMRNSFQAIKSRIDTLDKLTDRTEYNHTIKDITETVSATFQTIKAFQDLRSVSTSLAIINVESTITNVMNVLKPMATDEKIEIFLISKNSIPRIVGSAVAVRQIVMNLLLNAIHAIKRLPSSNTNNNKAPTSKGVIEIVCESSTSHLNINFRDTGTGIHSHLWNRIFVPGYSTRADGSGLGLPIALGFANLIDARISVLESFIPLGTTFLLEIPLRRKDK